MDTTPITQDLTAITMSMSKVIQDMDIEQKVYRQTQRYYKAFVYKSSPDKLRQSDGFNCPKVIYYFSDPVFGGTPEEIGRFVLYTNPQSLVATLPGVDVVGMDVSRLNDMEEDRQKVRDNVTAWLDLLAIINRV